MKQVTRIDSLVGKTIYSIRRSSECSYMLVTFTDDTFAILVQKMDDSQIDVMNGLPSIEEQYSLGLASKEQVRAHKEAEERRISEYEYRRLLPQYETLKKHLETLRKRFEEKS